MKLADYFEENKVEIGCDEVGRGCLAGPVVAAAVILPLGYDHQHLKDSKKLSARQRQIAAGDIRNNALAHGIGIISPKRIDEINILNASFEAMHLAIENTHLSFDSILVDGNRFRPYKDYPFNCIVKGDSKLKSIAAASILAKTFRDNLMEELDLECQGYGWATNMGYPTFQHKKAIERLGLSKYHRRSFKSALTQKQKQLDF